MITVSLKPLIHRQRECIGIYYSNNTGINTIVRKLAEVKWSQTNKCWYLPLEKESYNLLVSVLKGTTELDSSALKTYLQKRKQVVTATATTPIAPEAKTKAKSVNLVSPAWKLSNENLQALEKFVEQLKLKA